MSIKPNKYIGQLKNECMMCEVGIDVYGQDN